MSLELKRCYQVHLGLGVTFAGLLHFLGLVLIFVVIPLLFPPKAVEETGRIWLMVELNREPLVISEEQGPGTMPEKGSKYLGVPNGPDRIFSEKSYHGSVAGVLSDQSAAGSTGSNEDGWVEARPALVRKIVDSLNVAPWCIHRVLPDYPKEAREAGIRDTITVWVSSLITEKGEVGGIKINDPTGLFVEVVKKAAYECKYNPAIIGGKRKSVEVVCLYVFTPPKEKSQIVQRE